MIPLTLSLTLPGWLNTFAANYRMTTDINGQMEFIINLARHNIDQNHGGPFAAGVFASETGKLVALGINSVIAENLAMAHAELLALTLAQHQLKQFSLGSSDTHYHLVSSSEPCAMCLGAICWSGVSRIVCGAEHQAACNIGFDEGPLPQNWQQQLEQRNIAVNTGVCREFATKVLRDYQYQGGKIYNPNT